MDEALRAAFRATCYQFDTPQGRLQLRIDEPDPALQALLRNHAAGSAAVLTAFNPQANRRDQSANLQAQQILRRDLAAQGFTLYPGRNDDPAGEWVEESFLVVGISRRDARSFASRHDQLAFLWTDAASATPRLVETAARE
jgi:hypothetical protein